MFKPTPMKRVILWLMNEDAGPASQLLAALGSFAPDRLEAVAGNLPEAPAQAFREVYLATRARYAKLADHCGELPAEQDAAPPEAVSLAELSQINDGVGELWQICFREQDALRREQDNARRIAAMGQTLEQLAALDLDLSVLKRERRFLELRIGTVAVENLPRLAQALALTGFVARVFARSTEAHHAIVVGPKGAEHELSALLQAAGWRDIEVPPELMASPAEAHHRLAEAASVADAAIARQCAAMDEKKLHYRGRLEAARRALRLAGPLATLGAEALRGKGNLAVITGWIPARDAPRLAGALEERLPGRHCLGLSDPRPDELAQVPSCTFFPRWLKPFAALVRLYGTPRYGEVDPTALFACAYVLMFGMMFGDLGQGALIFLAGALLGGALREFRPFVLAIGAASALFGWLYGSVFLLEGLIHPVWLSPLYDPMRMLGVAIHWGIGFILLTLAISTYNHWIEGKTAEALWSASGAMGAVFFVSAVYWAQAWLVSGESSPPALGLAALAAAAIVFHAWRHAAGSRTERALIAGIEGFEAAMGFFANTLSFLRVAAFALNHVALALAVLTIAEEMGSFGHWLVVAVGNVVVLVLEGAVVAIQALRLNYYEGFSRFFRGDGRLYQPLGFGMSPADSGSAR